MSEASVKQQVLQAIERLPEDATLDDVAHVLQMHQMLARARSESAAGRKYTTEQMREYFSTPRES